jgi:hypothetical protein
MALIQMLAVTENGDRLQSLLDLECQRRTDSEVIGLIPV